MNCWWGCPSSEKTPPKRKCVCLLGGWVPSLSGQTGSYVANSVESLAHASGLGLYFLPEGCHQRRGTGFTLGVWENLPLSRMSSYNTPSCCFFFPQDVYSCWAPPEDVEKEFPSREGWLEPPNVKVWGIFGCWGWEIGRSVLILELILQNRQWNNWLIHCFPLRLHFCGFSCGSKSSEGWWYNIGEGMLELCRNLTHLCLASHTIWAVEVGKWG